MTLRQQNILVFFVLFFTFVIWANAFTAIGLLRRSLGAWELVELRFIPVGLISSVLVAIFYRQEFASLVKNHPFSLIASGFLVVPAYNLAVNFGQGYVNANAASLLSTLNPLFTLLLAHHFLGEPLTAKRLAGTLLAFGGLIVVMTWGKVGVTESVLFPLDKLHFAFIALLAPLIWAVYNIVVKPLTSDCSPAALNFSVLAVGCLPLYPGLNSRLIGRALALQSLEIYALAFLSLVCTIFAFYIWVLALKYWRASNASLFCFFNPPMTAIVAFFFLDLRISAWFFIGAAVMLAGVALAVFREGARARPVKPVL